MLKRFWVLMWLCCSSLAVYAQTGPLGELSEPPVTGMNQGVLRSFVVLCSDTMENLWVSSLLQTMGRLPRLREVYLWSQRFPSQEPAVQNDTAIAIMPDSELAKALRWAALHDFSFVLSVEGQQDPANNGTIQIQFRVFSVLSGRELHAGTFQDGVFSEQDLYQTFWLPLSAVLDSLEAQKGQGALTVHAVPGTRISGLTEKPVSVDQSGETVIPLIVPGTYSYRASAPGYRGREGIYTMAESPAELFIEQERVSKWLIELGSLMGQFGELWAHRLLFKEQFWIGFGLQEYWIGTYFPSPDDRGRYSYPVVSLPLLQPGITIGGRLADDLHFLRPYLSATFLLRLNTSLLRLDPAAAMVVEGKGGLEWKLAPGFAVFFDLGASFYPFCNGIYLAASRGGESRAPSTYLFSESWYLEIPVYRLGMRFFL